jgi:hypothetical protein
VQEQQGWQICPVRRPGHDDFPQRGKRTAPMSHHLDNEQWQRTHESFACKISNEGTRPSRHQREGRGLHEKPRPIKTGKTMSREKPPWNGRRSHAALRRIPRLAQCTTPTGDQGPRCDTAPALFRQCYCIVAGHCFTILTLVHQPSSNYKRGG